MDPTRNSNPSSETERNLDIAAKLLSARDLVGAKRFADLALESSSFLADDRADQILAVVDVLLAAQKRQNNSNLLDCYSILQIPSNHFDESLLKRNFRRLSLLLHPDRNRFAGSEAAFRVLNEAYSFLSDPLKRSEFDANFKSSNAHLGQETSFWTLCQFCCHVHLYAHEYLNKLLKCQNCKKGFNATELETQPIVVPGTDTYYATWGFFPLGFAIPGSSDWKPFVSVIPTVHNGSDVDGDGRSGGTPKKNEQPPPPPGGSANGGKGPGSGPGRKKKTTARKKVMSGLKSRFLGSGTGDVAAKNVASENGGTSNGSGEKDKEEEVARGININEAAKGVGEEDINMIMDLDATDYMFSSLQNLPFLKDDGMNMQMPQVGNRGF